MLSGDNSKNALSAPDRFRVSNCGLCFPKISYSFIPREKPLVVEKFLTAFTFASVSAREGHPFQH